MEIKWEYYEEERERNREREREREKERDNIKMAGRRRVT
jgi:hypothetical protein